MAPKRTAGSEDDTAARKTIDQKLMSKEPTTCMMKTESTASENGSTPLLKKRKIALGASKGLKFKLRTQRTAVSTTSAARDAVLGTPELFDAIFSFLPVKDILVRAPKACKNWKNAIDTSPIIQTRLWSKSMAKQPILPDCLSADHPLLTSAWAQEPISYRNQLERNPPLYHGEVAYNQLFYCISHKRFDIMPYRTNSEKAYNLAGFPVGHGFTINDFEKLSEAHHSWLDMYLIEPRVTTVRSTIASEFSDEYDEDVEREDAASKLVHDPCGLTFRTITERVDQICSDSPEARHVYLRPRLGVIRVNLFAGFEQGNPCLA